MTLRAQRSLSCQSPQSQGASQTFREVKQAHHSLPRLAPTLHTGDSRGPSSNGRNPTTWGNPQSRTPCSAPRRLRLTHHTGPTKQVVHRQREKSNRSGEIHRAEHPALPLTTSACTQDQQGKQVCHQASRRIQTAQGNPQSDPRPCSAPFGLRSAQRHQVAPQQEKSNPGAKSNRLKSCRAGASSAPSSHHF